MGIVSSVLGVSPSASGSTVVSDPPRVGEESCLSSARGGEIGGMVGSGGSGWRVEGVERRFGLVPLVPGLGGELEGGEACEGGPGGRAEDEGSPRRRRVVGRLACHIEATS